jgi:hypothetical protein
VPFAATTTNTQGREALHTEGMAAEVEPDDFVRRIVQRFPVARDKSQTVVLECGHTVRFLWKVPETTRETRCNDCAWEHKRAEKA